jgi:hypothetical protein
MLRVYYITYTTDSGETYRRISVPAENIPIAYITLQLQIPEAEITDIEITGKTITIEEAK